MCTTAFCRGSATMIEMLAEHVGWQDLQLLSPGAIQTWSRPGLRATGACRQVHSEVEPLLTATNQAHMVPATILTSMMPVMPVRGKLPGLPWRLAAQPSSPAALPTAYLVQGSQKAAKISLLCPPTRSSQASKLITAGYLQRGQRLPGCLSNARKSLRWDICCMDWLDQLRVTHSVPWQAGCLR